MKPAMGGHCHWRWTGSCRRPGVLDCAGPFRMSGPRPSLPRSCGPRRRWCCRPLLPACPLCCPGRFEWPLPPLPGAPAGAGWNRRPRTGLPAGKPPDSRCPVFSAMLRPDRTIARWLPKRSSSEGRSSARPCPNMTLEGTGGSKVPFSPAMETPHAQSAKPVGNGLSLACRPRTNNLRIHAAFVDTEYGPTYTQAQPHPMNSRLRKDADDDNDI